MHKRKWLAASLVILLLTSCATPYASRPIVMQGPGFDQYRFDAALLDCRVMLERQISDDDQANKAADSALLGALLGAALGAAMGGVIGRPGMGAAAGSIGGTAGGLGVAGKQAQNRQQVYNQALAGCLTEKGYHVLGVGQ